MMKKTLSILSILLTFMLLAGCAAQPAPAVTQPAVASAPPAPAVDPTDPVPAVEPAPAVEAPAVEPAAADLITAPGLQTFAYTMDIQSDSVKTDDGTEIMTMSAAYPVVTFAQKGAEDAINRHFQEEKRDFDENAAALAMDAKADVKERGAKDFPTYELSTVFTSARCDAAVASFIEDQYYYAGGAHGTSTRKGLTFDLATGEDLELEDIVTDEKAAEAFMIDFITLHLKASSANLCLFDDFETYLPEVVDDDDCWYMTKEGVMIVINDSVISCHAGGMIEMLIPYEDFTLLKPEYLPK